MTNDELLALYRAMSRAAVTLLACAALVACNGAAPAPPPPPPAPAVAQAKPPANEEHFHASESCGRDAREWFKANFGDGTRNDVKSQATSGYENHYNTKLNKCFAVAQTNTTSRDSKTGKFTYSLMKSLYDVNENKDLGEFFQMLNPRSAPMMCAIGESGCTSDEGWEVLVKPYMEQ